MVFREAPSSKIDLRFSLSLHRVYYSINADSIYLMVPESHICTDPVSLPHSELCSHCTQAPYIKAGLPHHPYHNAHLMPIRHVNALRLYEYIRSLELLSCELAMTELDA